MLLEVTQWFYNEFRKAKILVERKIPTKEECQESFLKNKETIQKKLDEELSNHKK